MSLDETTDPAVQAAIKDTARLAAEQAVEQALIKRQTCVDPEYLTTPQAAQYLNLSTQHLEIMRHQGEGPRFLKLPRLVRYRRADLDAWMAQYAQETAL